MGEEVEEAMRIGFIGGWGHHYLREFLVGSDASEYCAAVASDGTDSSAAKALAVDMGVTKWFDEPVDLLHRFKPDVVSIGSVYGHNAERISEALVLDIPVVCDKPIATTWAQLERLGELVAGTNRTIITELPFRSQPEFRAARHAVRSNKVGKVVLVTAQKSYRFGQRPDWYADRSEYGGTILWVASHAIDAVNYTVELGVHRVVSRHGNLTKNAYGSMEDHCVVMLEMEGGVLGVVHADYLRPDGAPTHGDDRMRIAGGNGVVEIKDGRCVLWEGSRAGQDITDWGSTHPVHMILLDAAIIGMSPDYSTAKSLQLGRLLLTCRDAADQIVGWNAVNVGL